MNIELKKYLKSKDLEKIKLILDSRNNISTPENVIFIAIKGKYNDGHKYIQDVYNKGVRCFIINKNFNLNHCDTSDFGDDKYPDATFFQVEDTLKTLQELAAYKRSMYNIPTIAITGSNGKTIVKEWLSYLLEDDFRITKSPKSYNSQVGVPLSLWHLNKNTELAIFEAGISQPNEMENLEKIIQPTIGILTNIGNAHQANFSSVEEKIYEKIKLFKNCETIVYCADNELVDEIIKKTYPKKHLIAWEIKFDTYNFIVSKIAQKDESSIYNFMICYNALNAFQNLRSRIDDFTFQQKIQSLPQIEMRLETLDGIQNSVIINDSYSFDLDSLEIALDYLNKQYSLPKNSMLILSDFPQFSTENIYKTISLLIENHKVEYFIGIGKELSENKILFPENSKFYASTDDFLTQINEINFTNNAILIKGARNFQFERIVKKLQRQNHETVLEINLSKVKHNFDFFKSRLKPETKIVGMVKALAYGNGAYEISKMLRFNRIDYLAVAIIDEGEQLRSQGISSPIIVMNPAIHYLNSMINNRLEPVIYSLDLLKELIKELEGSCVANFPIHIKIDTGMHRLGFSENEIDELCKIINSSAKITVASIFSHLVGADSPDLDYFTHEQVRRFENCYEKIVEKIGYKPIPHILNSAGIIRFPQYQFGMVRLGIGLYGLIPEITDKNSTLITHEIGLSNVATLKSIISQIHEIGAEETVSYGRSGKITKKSVIATIPIGYADGLNRKLGNGNWHFILNGQKVPTIGSICMDMCMLDITGISAKEGDEVIIFGDENSVFEMANVLDTIPYEVITSVSQRIKRVYLEE